MKTKTEVWMFFNNAKVIAVNTLNFSHEQKIELKKECDDLFFQATGSPICPAYWIGGWR